MAAYGAVAYYQRMSAQVPVTPRPAATVIMLRPAATGVEVLLTRRSASMAFMGGEWVFPGGAIAKADSALAANCFAVAACRESFEETGILLATDTAGRPCEPKLVRKLLDRRAAIRADAAEFATMLQQQHLQLDFARLGYWARWITPAVISRRFDTHFFVIAAPYGQDVVCDHQETTEAHWLLLEGAEPNVAITPPIGSPPTLYALLEIATAYALHRSVPAIIQIANRRNVHPVMPKQAHIDGESHVLFPWDPLYAETPGEGVPCDITLRERYADFPSRRRAVLPTGLLRQ